MKRIFDFVVSLILLILSLPVFFIISIAIKIDSEGPVIFRQLRVGLEGREFTLFKFRTMAHFQNKDEKLLTVKADPRITKVGKFLRQSKLDELPQLINILKGDMSFVGPRPEVSKYVRIYSQAQLEVLSVKPGLTDPASLKYINESELLDKEKDPELYYINKLLPDKLNLSIEYIHKQSFISDLIVIFHTLVQSIWNSRK